MYHNEDNSLITVDELCEMLMIGKSIAYRLLNSNEIESFKIGRHWKIPRASVEKYILEKSGLALH